MHERDLGLQDVVDYAKGVEHFLYTRWKAWSLTISMPHQRRLSFKRLAHYENRVVLAASIRLVDNLKVCDGNDVPNGLLEVFLRDGHGGGCSKGASEGVLGVQ